VPSLPTDFPHTAPEGYHYEVSTGRQNYSAIWLCHHRQYVYNPDPVRTIWGYYGGKARCYYAPVSSTKRGSKVDLRDTTPYTAMPLLKLSLDSAQEDQPAPIIDSSTQETMTTTFADYVATQDARNTIELNVRKYTLMLCDALEQNFKDRNHGTVGGYDAPVYKFVIESGRKYHKIIMEVPNNNRPPSRSVHAFVDKKTGEVYKSASFKAPAKGVRFNLLIIEQREWLLANADWAGGYLYKR